MQVSPELLPELRRVYVSDMTRYTKDSGRERRALETRQRKLDEKELNLWRAFTDHGMRPQIYEALAKECQAEREQLKILIRRMEAEREDCVDNLDAALQVLAEIGSHFMKCAPQQQRAILCKWLSG